jgi:hypothetical protein
VRIGSKYSLRNFKNKKQTFYTVTVPQFFVSLDFCEFLNLEIKMPPPPLWRVRSNFFCEKLRASVIHTQEEE